MMETYHWSANDYEQHSNAQQKWARELIEKLHFRGGESILDVGCGDGKVTAELARIVQGGSVIGVDNSEAMIKLATERYPSSQYPNLIFRLMDAGSLTFDNRFDVAFSNAVLHWVKDHKPVLDGLYRSLRSGGRILLQMGGKGNASEILSILKQIQAYSEWKPYFENFVFPYAFYGAEEYTKLLLERGFNVLRVELVPKDMEHNGRRGLEGWIRTTWLPYTQRIPIEKREKFIATISAKYMENMPVDPNGIVHVAMVRLEVEAEKVTKNNVQTKLVYSPVSRNCQ